MLTYFELQKLHSEPKPPPFYSVSSSTSTLCRPQILTLKVHKSTRMRCSEVPHPVLQKVLCLDLLFVCTNVKFTLYDTKIIVNVFTVHTATSVNIIMIILPQNSTTDTSCYPSLSCSRCLDDTLVTMVTCLFQCLNFLLPKFE